jgi:hypothetical protein
MKCFKFPNGAVIEIAGKGKDYEKIMKALENTNAVETSEEEMKELDEVE